MILTASLLHQASSVPKSKPGTSIDSEIIILIDWKQNSKWVGNVQVAATELHSYERF